jgi:hypothetical protein
MSKSQYYTQSEVRLAVDYATKEVRFATSAALLSTIDPTTITNADKFNYFYVKDGALVHNIYNNGSAREITKFGQGIKDSSYFYTFKDGLNQSIGIAIAAEEGEQDYNLDAELALPNINLNGAFITNTTSAKVIKYFKKTDLTVVAPPIDDVTPPVTPVTPGAVSVTIELPTDKYNVYFDGILQSITTVGGQYKAVITNVPTNSNHTLKIDELKDDGTTQEVCDIFPFKVANDNIVRLIADL